MIDDTLNTLEHRIQHAQNLDGTTRRSLEALLGELRREVDKLGNTEQAESVAAHTAAGAREALREERDEDLFSHTLEGMRKSVRQFEVSHPDLTAVVNNICQHLSNLGI